MKRAIKFSNLALFIVALSLLFSLQSYTHLSTSLISILPQGEFKTLIQQFNKTQNSKVLLLAVKGFDASSLAEMQTLEKKLLALPFVSKKSMRSNRAYLAHKEEWKLYVKGMDPEKVKQVDIKKELAKIYDDMTSSFFPVSIDQQDPFKLLREENRQDISLKNGHLALGDYGYLSYFQLDSKTLKEHEELYTHIQKLTKNMSGVTVFSPVFYYVENSNAIRSDVNQIIMYAGMVLLLLYLFILRDFSLLFNTLSTLGTSAIVATILITQLYSEVSIFVFVFGISISSIAIDYMFHHYIHDCYVEDKGFNKEVFFGMFTTVSAFFILSFTSFILIRQISLFAIFSLLTSYVIFAFIYPEIQFKKFHVRTVFKKDLHLISPKILFLFSLLLVFISTSWIRFDLNVKNLDYDNKTLKKTEQFFSDYFHSDKKIAFAIKAESIDALITNAQIINNAFSELSLPLASLVSRGSYEHNKDVLSTMDDFRTDLQKEARYRGFKEAFFSKAYRADKKYTPYSMKQINAYGIDIPYINGIYYSYGRIKRSDYDTLSKYDFVESLSIKERFERYMQDSMHTLMKLGLLALLVIFILLAIVTGKSILYAMLFLLFPLSMVSVYAYFYALNILHLFMVFVILAIGIDYAIYLSKTNDVLTQKAITYSLISTFAGFGVLIFSQINALYSMGVIATIGIVSILFLMVFVKGVKNES